MKKPDHQPKNEDIEVDEDFVFEADLDVGSNKGTDSETKVQELKQKLKDCQAVKQEYLDGWQRSQADYINLKQEGDRQRVKQRELGKASLLEDLIPLADSFELAMGNEAAWQAVPTNWRLGVEYIYRELQSILSKNRVSEIFPLNQRFNPEEHESIATVEVDECTADDLVIAVVKKGYKLGSTILRPAQVKVGVYRQK